MNYIDSFKNVHFNTMNINAVIFDKQIAPILRL